MIMILYFFFEQTHSPMNVDVDPIFERKKEADGVVMEILLLLVVITAEKRDFHTSYINT